MQISSGCAATATGSVENAAAAHLLAAEKLEPGSPVCGKAYFLTNGEPVNCWDWINEILTLAGVQPVTKSISYRAAYAGLTREAYADRTFVVLGTSHYGAPERFGRRLSAVR